MAMDEKAMQEIRSLGDDLKKLVDNAVLNAIAGTYDGFTEIVEAVSEAMNDLQPADGGNILEVRVQDLLDVEVELCWAQDREEERELAYGLAQWVNEQLPHDVIDWTEETRQGTSTFYFRDEQLADILRLTEIDLRAKAKEVEDEGDERYEAIRAELKAAADEDEFERGVDEGFMIVAEQVRKEREG